MSTVWQILIFVGENQDNVISKLCGQEIGENYNIHSPCVQLISHKWQTDDPSYWLG